MSTKEQRRQKKLAKKHAKEVSAKKARAREKASLQSLSGQMKVASAGAVDRCFISDHAIDPKLGLGSVLISRRMPDGRVGCVRLLVDALCLGIKQAEGIVCFPSQLSDMLEDFDRSENMRAATPAAARKFVEGAMAYAAQFGLQPHPDYRKVESIWADIDPSEHTGEFHYGDKDGKPFFVMGPSDSMLFADKIATQLKATAGEGNFKIDYEAVFDEQEQWPDDPELDVDIDDDVLESTANPAG